MSDNIKNIIEALIFSSEKPLSITQVKEAVGNIDPDQIRLAIEQLQQDYIRRDSAIQILEVAGGYRMCTDSKYASFVKSLFKTKQGDKLSRPSLETLAIVAYKQPVTKLDIEALRGVNVDGVVKTLLEKDLVRIAGRKNVIGRPFLYATTRQFLEYFGLKSLQDLPPIEEFATKSIQAQNVKDALKDSEIQESGSLMKKNNSNHSEAKLS